LTSCWSILNAIERQTKKEERRRKKKKNPPPPHPPTKKKKEADGKMAGSDSLLSPFAYLKKGEKGEKKRRPRRVGHGLFTPFDLPKVRELEEEEKKEKGGDN